LRRWRWAAGWVVRLGEAAVGVGRCQGRSTAEDAERAEVRAPLARPVRRAVPTPSWPAPGSGRRPVRGQAPADNPRLLISCVVSTLNLPSVRRDACARPTGTECESARCPSVASRRRVPTQVGVEHPGQSAYSLPVDDTPTPSIAPAEWLEALAESEADVAAGRIVPGEVVRQMFRDSIARLEAKQGAASPRKAASRR